MPSTILSDNGVSSGSAGLKTTASNDGILVLQTTTSGGTATNAVYIDTSQNVIIGANATDSGAKTRVVFGTSQNGIQIKDSNDTSGAAFLIFQNGSNSNFATISRDGTNNSLSIGTVSAITFPATQVASAGANTLDDYEEGQFQPTLTDSSGNSATMDINTFRYTKVGQLVFVTGTLSWTSTSALTAGSRLRLSGLPFVSSNIPAGNYRAAAIVGSSSSGTFTLPTAQIKMGVDPGVNYIWFTNVTGNNVDNGMVKGDIGNSGVIYGITLTYQTST